MYFHGLLLKPAQHDGVVQAAGGDERANRRLLVALAEDEQAAPRTR